MNKDCLHYCKKYDKTWRQNEHIYLEETQCDVYSHERQNFLNKM